jgi:rhamnosyltransferase subunit B
MARIILVTIGSLGDLYPFIGIACALKAQGHEPIMAVPIFHVEKCRAAGLEAHGIFPDYETLGQQIGEDAQSIVRNIMKSPDYLVRQIMLRGLADSARQIDALAEGADLIVTSMFALAAPIIAQKRTIPIVPLLLQPLAILSAKAPSIMPDLPFFARPPLGRLGQAWNHLVIKVMKAELLRRYGKSIDAVRHAFGLGRTRCAPMFELDGNVPIQIAAYDPLFAPLPADALGNIVATGFPNFNLTTDPEAKMSARLDSFLASGPPPIVFTLGSFAVFAPGDFYSQSLMAARALGQRCVLLIGAEGTPPQDLGEDVCIVNYTPHSKLFPRASCIVHHGGIGTTGQALMAGKPQLVVPFMGDQPDNASRIIAMGAGAQLPARNYTARSAIDQLSALLGDANLSKRAQTLSELMIKDGSLRAANAIIEAAAIWSRSAGNLPLPQKSGKPRPPCSTCLPNL